MCTYYPSQGMEHFQGPRRPLCPLWILPISPTILAFMVITSWVFFIVVLPIHAFLNSIISLYLSLHFIQICNHTYILLCFCFFHSTWCLHHSPTYLCAGRFLTFTAGAWHSIVCIYYMFCICQWTLGLFPVFGSYVSSDLVYTSFGLFRV